MNGPEHFTYAEHLLDLAGGAEVGSDHEVYLVAKAQVHAVLALTAATVAAANVAESRVGPNWLAAVNPQPPRPQAPQ